MSKEKVAIIAFCAPQITFLRLMIFLRIIENAGSAEIHHPITQQYEAGVQYFKASMPIMRFVFWMNDRLLTKEGKYHKDRLISCGKIRYANQNSK